MEYKSSETSAKHIKSILAQPIVSHIRPACQIKNYCYLIAGIEMLLSCQLFINYIGYYLKLAESSMDIAKSDTCRVCYLLNYYIKRKDDDQLSIMYAELENTILGSFDITGRGGTEDINIVFLFFEKDEIYSSLFSPCQYLDNHQMVDQKYNSILIDSNPSKYLENLEIYNISGIHAVAICDRGHYEIFRRTIYQAKTPYAKFIAMNTNSLLPCQPKSVIIFCTKRIMALLLSALSHQK